MIAHTPKPPYYAIIFTSKLTESQEGYEEMAAKMLNLAQKQSGFLGLETARDSIGITVSYWKDLAAISNWKAHQEHLVAQKNGQEKWYKSYHIRIAKVERAYDFYSLQSK